MSNGEGASWKAGLLLLIVLAGGSYEVGHFFGGESQEHIHDEIAITEQLQDSVLRAQSSASTGCRITDPSGDQRKVYVEPLKNAPLEAIVVVTDAGGNPKIVQCSLVQWGIDRPTRLVTVWMAKKK